MKMTRYYWQAIERQHAENAKVGDLVWIDGTEWRVTEQGLEQTSRFEEQQ